MATNVEIKARVTDVTAFRERIEALSETPAELIHQEDIFFHVPKGRLKLRIFSVSRGELIYYERADRAGPKQSEYLISATAEPLILKQVLEASFGVRGVVRKQRWLSWVGNTRIHMDEVEGLGSFVELEVVLAPGQDLEQGEARAAGLMDQIGIIGEDLVEGAYIDLVELKAGKEAKTSEE